jgi:hypothetical protein
MEPVSRRSAFAPPPTPLTRRLLVYFASGAYTQSHDSWKAEAVAFVVCHAIGLDTNTSSSDYIQLHAGDRATLAESLGFVQQSASPILQVIAPGESPAHSV